VDESEWQTVDSAFPALKVNSTGIGGNGLKQDRNIMLDDLTSDGSLARQALSSGRSSVQQPSVQFGKQNGNDDSEGDML
jgi:hypothetical protein